ncbi:uncharacterized protein BDW43DRAFT_192201 [Aspergillus alliaceus]|uniref:uncharacterized protein n=1 Tax=Petromyces alliaceus TaxID=209559 RepID=UPI0012A48498|nr:uncharacterized protein BDW43DRAFT_192201 [Aspergillus alliaceus]KAB8229314.1 hypothetical protein BDW43DRAFT_192201 [Aspergillus alliaceus]
MYFPPMLTATKILQSIKRPAKGERGGGRKCKTREPLQFGKRYPILSFYLSFIFFFLLLLEPLYTSWLSMCPGILIPGRDFFIFILLSHFLLCFCIW